MDPVNLALLNASSYYLPAAEEFILMALLTWKVSSDEVAAVAAAYVVPHIPK